MILKKSAYFCVTFDPPSLRLVWTNPPSSRLRRTKSVRNLLPREILLCGQVNKPLPQLGAIYRAGFYTLQRTGPARIGRLVHVVQVFE